MTVDLTTLPLDRINTEGRTRQEYRNLDSLARSISERGLLSPPYVRYIPESGAYSLICGGRRLAAIRSLGWAEVPVILASDDTDELEALLAEGEENTEREPFTPAEAVRHRQRIREVEARRAKERQREGNSRGGSAERVPSKLDETPRDHRAEAERTTRHRTAKATGFGATTLDKAEEIVTAAQSPETPEPVRQVAQKAAEALEKPGAKVDREFRQYRDEVAKSNPDVAAANYRKALTKALERAGELAAYEPERVAAVADESLMWSIGQTCQQIADWHQQITSERGSGLRAISGGRK